MSHKPTFEVLGGHDAAMTLDQAILLYRSGGDQTFATVHAVGEKDGVPMLLEGKPLTPAAAVRLARDLSRRAVRGGFVPPNLLYLDGETTAWWIPAARRHIAFRAAELGADERGEVVPHPALVFAVSGSRNWRVWAIAGKERPDPTSALFQAPYFNVSSDGVICIGSVKVPESNTAEAIEAWTSAFFGSFFTHPSANGSLVKYKGGAFKFWRDMLDGKHGQFPEAVLVPTKRTLGEALSAGKGR